MTERRSGGRSGRITLRVTGDQTLSVPQWMLEPQAQQMHIADKAVLGAAVFFQVIALLREAWCADARTGNPEGAGDAAATPPSVRRKTGRTLSTVRAARTRRGARADGGDHRPGTSNNRAKRS